MKKIFSQNHFAILLAITAIFIFIYNARNLPGLLKGQVSLDTNLLGQQTLTENNPFVNSVTNYAPGDAVCPNGEQENFLPEKIYTVQIEASSFNPPEIVLFIERAKSQARQQLARLCFQSITPPPPVPKEIPCPKAECTPVPHGSYVTLTSEPSCTAVGGRMFHRPKWSMKVRCTVSSCKVTTICGLKPDSRIPPPNLPGTRAVCCESLDNRRLCFSRSTCPYNQYLLEGYSSLEDCMEDRSSGIGCAPNRSKER